MILPVLPPRAGRRRARSYHINPTGKFVVGGPHGDSGVTGRKIIVDTYGGMGRHGGGAFSGKDPTKVDRSAAYMARYVAKNIVASGLAERCEIQLAYAIGVSEPVSVHVDTEGTGQIPDSQIAELVRKVFPLTPSGIIKHLDLRRPIYRKTASGGHFGRSEPEFTWERTDKAEALRQAAGAASRWPEPADRSGRDRPMRLHPSCDLDLRSAVGPAVRHLRSPDRPICGTDPRRWHAHVRAARKSPPAPRSRAAFGGEPAVLGRAPGRVELLGNHTDYNGGLVLAAAIDRSTVVVGRPAPTAARPGSVSVELRPDRRLRRSTPSSRASRDRGAATSAASSGRSSEDAGRWRRASRPRSRATSRSAPGCPARRASRRRSPCS